MDCQTELHKAPLKVELPLLLHLCQLKPIQFKGINEQWTLVWTKKGLYIVNMGYDILSRFTKIHYTNDTYIHKDFPCPDT